MRKSLKKIWMILSMFILCISSIQTTYGYLAVSTKSLMNIFIPNEQFALKITKELQHPYGEEYQIPDSIQFTFDIDFGKEYKDSPFETSIGTLKTDEKGHMLVSLKPNESFYIKGFSEQQHIVVTELESELKGFHIVGDNVQEVDVNELTNAEMLFTNKYTPEAVYGSIIEIDGYKTIEGFEYCDKEEFTYVLEYYEDEEWKMIEDTSITYQDGKVNFFDFANACDEMIFKQLGEYEFRIREKNDDQKEEIRYFNVVISDDDMNGSMEMSQIYGEDQMDIVWEDQHYHITAYFFDRYVPSEEMQKPIQKEIQITKKLTNKGEQKASLEGFEFVLEDMQTHEKIMSFSDQKGNATFTLKYDLNDIKKTFEYRIYETNQGIKGMTYDTNVYELNVQVELDEEKQIKANVFVNGEKYDHSKIRFHNIYHVIKSSKPPTGDKTNLLFWMVMALLSGTSFIILLFCDKNDKKAYVNKE